MNSAKDEHLPQANGSDTGQSDQTRDGEGHSDSIRWSVHRPKVVITNPCEQMDGLAAHDQNMDANADDHRDMSERGEKKCSDTSEGLTSAEEEPRQVGRPNREPIAMDTEADNTNMPRNEDSDLQLDMGREDEAPESGLSNIDRESTKTIGSEMGSALPKGLDVPSKDRYPQTGIDPMQGKKKGGQQYVVGDTNMTTDNAWCGYGRD